MQSLFDFVLLRFSKELQDLLKEAVEKENCLNPNENLQQGAIKVLESIIDENRFEKLEKAELAALICYLTPNMQASNVLLQLLCKLKEPYIDLFVAFFEEEPSQYHLTLKKIELLSESIDEKQPHYQEKIANILNMKAWVYGQVGEIEKLYLLYQEGMKKIVKSDNIVEQYAIQECLLTVLWWMMQSGSEYDIEQILLEIEPYVKKYKLYFPFSSYLNLYGTVESTYGSLMEAIKYYTELYTLHEQYHDFYRLSIAMGNLAEVYLATGYIEKAKEMMEKAIDLYHSSTGKFPYMYLMEMGNIHFIVNNFELAEQSFLKAYEIQKNEQTLYKAFILFEVAHFYLRTEQLEQAEKYIGEYIELANIIDTSSVKARLEYLLGFFNMLNHNLANAISSLISAVQFSQMSRERELMLFSIIQLAIAYLQFYKLTEKQESLNQALNYIDSVVEIGKEHHLSHIITLALMIRALLSSINDNIDQSIEDITEAKSIVEKTGFETLAADLVILEKIIKESKNTSNMKVEGPKMIENILPQFKTMLSFKVIQKVKQESELLGILVITESGVPIFSKLKSRLKTNDLVLSGLLMAINQLSTNIISEKEQGRLQDVHYENFSITIQTIKNGIVAIIASKLNAEIKILATTIAERIGEVPVVITEASGDIEEKIKDIIIQMQLLQ